MNDHVFTDQTESPSEDQLRSALNATYPHFLELKTLTGQMKHEWKYYSPKSGWVFRVQDHTRALFYLTPLENKFMIGMTLNELEKTTLLNSIIDDGKKNEIKTAAKHPEGYPLRFMVESESELNQVVDVLSILHKI
jgi:hypothetical protein